MGNEEETFGIENLKKIISVPVEVGNVIPEVVKATGMVGKVRAMGSLIDEIMDLVGVDYSLLKKEMADLDEKEKQALLDHAKAKYDIPDDDLEEIVEECFDLAVCQVELGVDMVNTAKKIMSYKKDEE